jgi:hypothetical protein
MFRTRKPAVPFENYSISQITDNTITQAAAISPDGKYILSEVVDAGLASLWLRHVPTNSDTEIAAPAEAFYTNFDFSPSEIISISEKRGLPRSISLTSTARQCSEAIRKSSRATLTLTPGFLPTASASPTNAATIPRSAGSSFSWPIPMARAKR